MARRISKIEKMLSQIREEQIINENPARVTLNMEFYSTVLRDTALRTGRLISEHGDLFSSSEMNDYLYDGRSPEEY